MACHGTEKHVRKRRGKKGSLKQVLLMGNPNVGKSVVFSRLTGVRVIASNYPGTTVGYTRGYMKLGDGTAESHRRMAAAVADLWPYTHELFTDDELALRLEREGLAPLPSSLRPQWTSVIDDVLARATLDRPADGWRPGGGRAGRHTEHLSYLLAEMQVLHRAHPRATW